MKALLGEIVVCVIAAVVVAVSAYWVGRFDGVDVERAKWKEMVLVAERAARQTETDLAQIAAASAKRIAEKERLLDERARKLDADWRATLADLPRCRLPAVVGVRLDEAAGLPAVAPVARPPDPGPADPDPDYVELADALDTCRRNNEAGRTNAGRLTEAARWYEEVRNRVNAGVSP